MAPNRSTELFSLGDVAGLAAGHRPCFECRRARFLAFRDAWEAGNRWLSRRTIIIRNPGAPPGCEPRIGPESREAA
jgi:hypothetical protein